MSEMVEPDRTIIIVSIIGLVVLWGAFFYHRYVQDDRNPPGGQEKFAEMDSGVDALQPGECVGEQEAKVDSLESGHGETQKSLGSKNNKKKKK